MATDKFIAQQANRTGDAVGQLGRKGVDVSTLPTFSRNIIEIGNFRVRETKTPITGDNLIWGNEDYAIWGTFKWGNELTTAFLLGHPSSGLLGSQPLGGQLSVSTVIGVYNDNDYFPEGFWNDRFIDETSTGSWDSINENYILDDGEYFESTIIAKEDKIYKIATVIINTEDDNEEYLTIYVSNDGGTTWQVVQNNTATNLTNGTIDGLKVKIINATVETSPLTIPITIPIGPLTIGTPITLTDFSVKYSE